jgi:hypothetical protein
MMQMQIPQNGFHSIAMGFKGQKEIFAMLDDICIAKKAKSFVNVIQHGDGDVTCTPPIFSPW